MGYKTKKSIALVVSLLLCGHVLMFYALPPKIFISIFMAFAILFILLKWQDALLVSGSLVLATLFFWVFLKVLGIDKSIYYRPQEILQHFDSDSEHGRYKKNAHFEMEMPHGDLKALAVNEVVTPEPRKVIFHTDSLGFRNSNDYHGQKYLMVGDSFIVGSGTTQNEIITEQLLNEYEIDSYNLAFPGGIEDYANYIKTFEKRFGDKYKAFLFLFEGNDFPISSEEKPLISGIKTTKTYTKLKDYYNLFNKTVIFRVMYSLMSIYSYKTDKEKASEVHIRTVNGRPIAFYKKYISVSERDYVIDNSEIEKHIKLMKNKVASIFFIPTKYRVYYKYISGSNPDKVVTLPNKQLELIQRIGNKHGVKVVDLTPALIEESDKILQKGKLSFWQDDTHWNKNGIAVAAKMVAENILGRGPMEGSVEK
jgi:SGNH hydrolase-like domain, acetyltransferase AlgX